MLTIITIISLACLSGAEIPDQEFVADCQTGFEKTHDPSDRWLGSSPVTINNSGLKPLTNRCLDESPDRPTKKSLEQVIAENASDKPAPSTHPATLVAWVEKGIVHAAVNAPVGEFEISLLHLIADSDGEENITDEWLAGNAIFLGPFKNEWLKTKEGQHLVVFHLGSAKEDIRMEEAIQPLINLKILSLKSS